ncbi:dihydrodipicolinate synthase family protein [Chitinimonas koreensis]|uniref:dihydrodipicolinate synthase family protein n=1 Tax=Chitinimonas koreensis TaxID=356302 RepID=UPI0003FCEEFD|nr:dihydrodipicolinate synthase family protein [Chitinimonas koreensis]QNM98412.1 dihydrodipicolinate synthase family protein [Chitinimonas koreensis]
MSVKFEGVLPAITTPFNADLSVDHGAATANVQWLAEAGCKGFVPCGSLGESATLDFDEKVELIETCARATDLPVIPGIAALSTREAVKLAKAAEAHGARALMVLPPYVYSTDWREMKAHVAAVIGATRLPCIVYNNPVAYRTDFQPEQILELADQFDNVRAVKESSTDVRRITAIKALAGDRLALGVGVDDALVEGVAAGAQFWIAGLVDALPHESVRLFELARAGRWQEAAELYAWFLPLLKLDTVPKFVQLIKLVQEKLGVGHRRVRPPRLELAGEELAAAEALIERALAQRPPLH